MYVKAPNVCQGKSTGQKSNPQQIQPIESELIEMIKSGDGLFHIMKNNSDFPPFLLQTPPLTSTSSEAKQSTKQQSLFQQE